MFIKIRLLTRIETRLIAFCKPFSAIPLVNHLALSETCHELQKGFELQRSFSSVLQA